MEFVFTDEQVMIAETARAFFNENATSGRIRAAMAATGSDAGIDRSLWSALCTDLGLAGVGLPEERGGIGLGLVELAIIAEAAGATVAPLPMLSSLVLSARAIALGGSASQRDTYLPALLSGERIAAYAHDASVSANGNALTGSVGFVAHGAAADLFVVTNNDGAWIVAADAPGVTITALTTMDGGINRLINGKLFYQLSQASRPVTTLSPSFRRIRLVWQHLQRQERASGKRERLAALWSGHDWTQVRASASQTQLLGLL